MVFTVCFQFVVKKVEEEAAKKKCQTVRIGTLIMSRLVHCAISVVHFSTFGTQLMIIHKIRDIYVSSQLETS